MELIASNLEDNDCMIVAAYNALILAGREADYKTIQFLCLANGWYNPEGGFSSQFVDDLFDRLNIAKEVPEGTTTADIRENVKAGIPYVILCKDLHKGGGHAMVAVKGEKGVKIVNPDHFFKGWRTICKLLKRGRIDLNAYEISL
jgi:hypothetical protein